MLFRSGRLVAEDEREGLGQVTVDHVQIRRANTARCDPNEDLLLFRWGEIDLEDLDRLTGLPEHCRPRLHSGEPTSQAAYNRAVRAAVLRAVNEPLAIEDLDLAPPGPEEVTVRLEASGVCHSDWNLVSGVTQNPFPVVLGHEGAGVVEELGDRVTTVAVGDHVVLQGSGQLFSGHTLKHVVAAFAAWPVIASLAAHGRRQKGRHTAVQAA